MHLVQVLLPLRLDWIPTYSCTVPLQRGQAVCVHFARKSYVGIVWRTDVEKTGDFKILPIDKTQTSIPALTEEEMQLWEFTASYYLCTLGEVYKAVCAKQNLNKEQKHIRLIDILRQRYEKVEVELGKKHRSEALVERLKSKAASIQEQLDILRMPAQTTAVSRRRQKRKPILLIANQRIRRYVCQIRAALKQGAQVLVLSPTVAHSHILEQELRSEFGDLLLINNSQKSHTSRLELADCLRRGENVLVLGTRSSVFLPFSNLALVIVDSEQEVYYKQTAPAPRYNARDLALYLAYLHGSEVVLGTNAPSLESLYNCKTGKFDSIRIDDSFTCPCTIIDIAEEKRKHGMSCTLSRKLIDAAIKYQGTIYLIRAWEKTGDVLADCELFLASKDVKVLALNEFLAKAPEKNSLVALLGADAYLSKEDFRSDERAIQLVSSLRSLCSCLIIQCNSPHRFNPDNNLEGLMKEREEFGFPPFKRIVDVCEQGSHILVSHHFLNRDASLAFHKAQIQAGLKNDEYADVDPEYSIRF